MCLLGLWAPFMAVYTGGIFVQRLRLSGMAWRFPVPP